MTESNNIISQKKIIQIYDILFNNFGAQGWWPVTPLGGCRGELGQRPVYGMTTKSEKQKFEIILGAILTQNTAWTNAEQAIMNLNREGLIDIRRLRAASKEKLVELIRPAGYFNQKSERLKIISKYLYDNYKGNLKVFFSRDTEKIRDELLQIKGIGPETADSILLYAANKPTFVVDSYTKRIFSRVGIINENADYDSIKKLFEDSVPKHASIYNEYHALIVELAKRNCKTEPDCTTCILRKVCHRAINSESKQIE